MDSAPESLTSPGTGRHGGNDVPAFTFALTVLAS
jgi:hypothetical protein